MKQIKRRKSTQRERIFEIIKTCKTHPTALYVYDILRKQSKTVSLGNVYRNIKILIEERRIANRNFSLGLESYDAVTQLHYHFICDKCKEVTDLPLENQVHVNDLAVKTSGHDIDRHTIQFYGVCEKCKLKRRNKNSTHTELYKS